MDDPTGFQHRDPLLRKAVKRHTGAIVVDGPNHKWAADGFEKLKSLGFCIYGIRDYWGKIIGNWVVPNDRVEEMADYLYLTAVRQIGGIINSHFTTGSN